MSKKFRQIITFSLPTIIVVIVSVYFYQQVVPITNDDSSDTVSTKVELSLKNINTNYLPIVFISSARHLTLSLEAIRISTTPYYLSKQNERLITINNNSPPNNLLV